MCIKSTVGLQIPLNSLILEDNILHSHLRENLISYTVF
jgi:hypothetical protein